MEINYDSGLKQIIDEKFDFLEIIPVPMSLLDVEKRVFVKTNDLLNDVLELEKNQVYSFEDIIMASDFCFDEFFESEAENKTFFVFTKIQNGIYVPMITNAVKYVLNGKKFVLLSHLEILKNIEPLNVYIRDFSEELDNQTKLEEILSDISWFACILSINKKDVLYANKTCIRIFGNNLYAKEADDLFSGLEYLDKLNNQTQFSVEFNSIVGSKWFALSASYINWKDENSILILGKDISEIKKLEDRIIRKAVTDDLTKVFNRQAGLDFINDYLHDTSKDRKAFTIAYVDIEGIKDIRDEFGFDESDKYILTIVEIIKTAIRQTDIFARIYDTGFIILFPNCMREVVENIMTTIDNKVDLINTQEPSYFHSISYGVLEISPDEEMEADEVIKLVTEEMVERYS